MNKINKKPQNQAKGNKEPQTQKELRANLRTGATTTRQSRPTYTPFTAMQKPLNLNQANAIKKLSTDDKTVRNQTSIEVDLFTIATIAEANQLKRKAKENLEQERETKRLKSETKRLNLENILYVDTIQDLEEENTRLEADKDALEQEKAQLMEEQEALRQTIDDLENQALELQNHVDVENHVDVDMDIDINDEVQAPEPESPEHSPDSSSSKEQIAKLQDTILTLLKKDRELTATLEKNKDVQESVARQQEQIVQLNLMLEKAQKQVTTLEEKLTATKDFEKHKNYLEKEIQALKLESKIAQSQSRHYEEMESKAHENIVTLKKNLTEATQEHTKLHIQDEEKITELKQRLSNAQSDAEAKALMAIEAKEKFVILEKKLEATTKSNEQLLIKQEKYDQESVELFNLAFEAHHAQDKKKEEYELATSQVKELKKQIYNFQEAHQEERMQLKLEIKALSAKSRKQAENRAKEIKQLISELEESQLEIFTLRKYLIASNQTCSLLANNEKLYLSTIQQREETIEELQKKLDAQPWPYKVYHSVQDLSTTTKLLSGLTVATMVGALTYALAPEETITWLVNEFGPLVASGSPIGQQLLRKVIENRQAISGWTGSVLSGLGFAAIVRGNPKK